MKAVINILQVVDGKVYVEVEFDGRLDNYDSLDAALNIILEEDPTAEIVFNQGGN